MAKSFLRLLSIKAFTSKYTRVNVNILSPPIQILQRRGYKDDTCDIDQNKENVSRSTEIHCDEAGTGKIRSDGKTHTGQKWDEDDYRNARFVNVHKTINKSFAIDLIAQEPPTQCKSKIVMCDGGGLGAMGHPVVYINLENPGTHTCGYCGLRYYLEKGRH